QILDFVENELVLEIFSEVYGRIRIEDEVSFMFLIQPIYICNGGQCFPCSAEAMESDHGRVEGL
ncbi:MAG: hypothetical protein U9Q15_04580, partial [Patescibacteria group bacterium]|nr:hypothetical protein [Patescibacteria group bacterium]